MTIDTGNTMGWVRRVDPLGRIVVPKEMRDILGFEDGVKIEMFSVGGGIFVRKFLGTSAMCIADELLTGIREGNYNVSERQELRDTLLSAYDALEV